MSKKSYFHEVALFSAHSPYNNNCMYPWFSEFSLSTDGADTWMAADFTEVSRIPYVAHASIQVCSERARHQYLPACRPHVRVTSVLSCIVKSKLWGGNQEAIFCSCLSVAVLKWRAEKKSSSLQMIPGLDWAHKVFQRQTLMKIYVLSSSTTDPDSTGMD